MTLRVGAAGVNDGWGHLGLSPHCRHSRARGNPSSPARRLPRVSLPLVGRVAAAGWGWPQAQRALLPHPTPSGPPSPQGGGRTAPNITGKEPVSATPYIAPLTTAASHTSRIVK